MADKKEYTDFEKYMGRVVDKANSTDVSNAEQVASNSGTTTNPYDLSGATSTSSIDTTAVENAINNTVGAGDKEIGITDGKISKDPLAGLGNTRVKENIPKYNTAPSERVEKGQNNTWIILGRDRNMGFASGYGGKGHTRAG